MKIRSVDVVQVIDICFVVVYFRCLVSDVIVGCSMSLCYVVCYMNILLQIFSTNKIVKYYLYHLYVTGYSIDTISKKTSEYRRTIEREVLTSWKRKAIFSVLQLYAMYCKV